MGAVQSAGQVVAWVCDPMHGNTECVAGYKTRRYDNIRAEVCTTPAALHGQKICSFLAAFAQLCIIGLVWVQHLSTEKGGVDNV